MWYKLQTPLMMFLDNINETQNRYYYKASSRRKQKFTYIYDSEICCYY